MVSVNPTPIVKGEQVVNDTKKRAPILERVSFSFKLHQDMRLE
jgi:hypothetical protein